MPVPFARSLAAAALAFATCAAPAAAAPLAGYIEFADQYTSQTGLARLLDEVGYDAQAIDPAGAFPQDAELIIAGSFITENPAYRTWMSRNATALRAWVVAGGVFVEMTQADQTGQMPALLDAEHTVRRTDLDAGPVRLLHPDHPLVATLPRAADNGANLALATHHGRTGSWETWIEQSGFRIIAEVAGSNLRDQVILEAQMGTGRVILTSLYFDKLFNAEGTMSAPVPFQASARAFFMGLRRYTELVAAGEMPDVEPTPGYEPPEPLPYVEGSITFVVMPDTQVYAEAFPQTFIAQTQWIVDNAQARNIAFVLHEGDITNRNTREQWQNAKNAMSLLDGVVPYAMAPGNHDYGPGGNAADRSTFFNEYFPVADYSGLPTFGGTHEPGRMDSSYHLFEAGGMKWLAMALEWGPRNGALAWADSVIAQHPDRIVMIVTHAHMFSDETRYAWSLGKRQSWNPYYYGTSNDPDGTNDGEDIWQKVGRKHGNIAMIFNGHVLNDGTGRQSSGGDEGNTVHEILANYQFRPQGGEGYFRLVELLPDRRTIQVKTYSPTLNRYLVDEDQQFVLELDVVLEPR